MMGVLVYFKILICNFITCSLAKEKRENVDFGYVFERTHTEIFHVFFESLNPLRPVPPRLFFSKQLPLFFFPGRRIAEAEIYLLTAKVSVVKKSSLKERKNEIIIACKNINVLRSPHLGRVSALGTRSSYRYLVLIH